MVEPPEFTEIRKDHLKEDIRANFMVIVDKLICYSEQSMITHSALITDDLQVVEATLPKLKKRKFQREENYYIHVFRVEDGVDGSKVLNYLPQPADEVNADPDSYALIMATLSAAACLFRLPADQVTPPLVTVLKCVLYKVCEYLDSKIFPSPEGDTNWFCSELTSYTYNMTALMEKNSAYKLKIDTKEKKAETIFDLILNYYDEDSNDELIQKPQEYDDMFSIAKEFFKNELLNNNKDASENKISKEIKKNYKFFVAAFKKILAAEEMTSEEFKGRLVKYMSAFVMPSDLSKCLPNEYWISNERNYESAKKTV